MNRFKISEELGDVLRKQQTQLSITTAVSTIGLVFVVVVNALTEIDVVPEIPDLGLDSLGDAVVFATEELEALEEV